LSYEDTCECIDSILNCKFDTDHEILVIDNGSKNGSGEKIKAKYNYCPNIEVLILNKNLGFAKGNNVGFDYAKNKLNSNFIILLNNDIIIKQKDFIHNLYHKYDEQKFHVLGPNIISLKDGLHQNPQKITPITKKEVQRLIFKYSIYQILNRLNIETPILNLYRSLKYFLSTDDTEKNRKNLWLTELEDVQLHGSCLIFSPDYISKYKGIYSKTFLYMEEDILFYIARKENIRMLYTPELEVFHKEDSSTDKLCRSERDKRFFIYKHTKNSARELTKIMKDEDLYKKDIIDNYY